MKACGLCFAAIFVLCSCTFLNEPVENSDVNVAPHSNLSSKALEPGEITENGTNFVAPWAPGDIWNYGAGWCSNDSSFDSTHKPGTQNGNCIDINHISGNADLGMPFFAVFDGYVLFNQYWDGYGNLLIIASEDNEVQFRMGHHNEKSFLEVGEHVKKGQVISYCGNTGNSNYAHGHYCFDDNISTSNYSPIPFETIDGEIYNEKYCLDGEIVDIQSSNDFAFQRVEQEFGGAYAFGSTINEDWGYRGIHWYYPFNNNLGGIPGNIDYRTCLIQDWYNDVQGKQSAIVYDVLLGARRAYVVHSGFAASEPEGWLLNSNSDKTSGPKSKLGMPISNEFIDHGTTFQNFMHGYLTWRPNGRVEYHDYICPGCASSSLSAIANNLVVEVKNSLGHSIWWSKKFSYLFAESYNRNAQSGIWLGYADDVVKINNGYFVQYFTNLLESYLQSSAIIYDPDNKKNSIFSSIDFGGTHEAYVVRGGFWDVYSKFKLDGKTAFSFCGAPLMDEITYLPSELEDYINIARIEAFQLFEKCYMVWDSEMGIEICIQNNNNIDCYILLDDNTTVEETYTTEETYVEETQPNPTDNTDTSSEQNTDPVNNNTDPVNNGSDGQGGAPPELGYCGDIYAYSLYCWASPLCENYGSGYWSPAVWSPENPNSQPPSCSNSNNLSTKYPAGWECCCGNITDWVPGGNRGCISGTWGSYTDSNSSTNTTSNTNNTNNTNTTTNNNSVCSASCPSGSVFMCWDNNSCYNYGNGYGSPPLWSSNCYTDNSPACGQWVNGSAKYPTNWQCCCGYESNWQNGSSNNICLSSVYSVP